MDPSLCGELGELVEAGQHGRWMWLPTPRNRGLALEMFRDQLDSGPLILEMETDYDSASSPCVAIRSGFWRIKTLYTLKGT